MRERGRKEKERDPPRMKDGVYAMKRQREREKKKVKRA